MGNDFQVIGSKFRAILFSPEARQSLKLFTPGEHRDQVFVTGTAAVAIHC